jgi:hypothetical protein
VPDGTWTLQEYVMNPAKYGERKFDMRVWAMITSTDPLRIVLDRTLTLTLTPTLPPTPTPTPTPP